MRFPPALRAALWALLAGGLLALPPARAAGTALEPATGIGWATPIGGTVEHRSAATGTTRLLRAGKDARTPVYPGDHLRCLAKATLEIDLGAGALRPADCASGYPLPPAQDGVSKQRRDAMSYLADMAGVTRDAGLILYPAADALLFVGHAEIYWVPGQGRLSIQLLAESSDAVIVPPRAADARRGSLANPELAHALRQLQALQGPVAVRL